MKPMEICHIVGAGERSGLVPRPGPKDWVIAADGGYARLLALGVPADLVVGDFDSLPERPAHPRVVALPREKDETDMLAAIRLGLKKGYRAFYLYGGTGGRTDHTLANLQCLAFLSKRGARGFLFGANEAITAITDGEIAWGPGGRGTVSVFAHGGRAEGVSIRGLKYPLCGAVLRDDFPLGVSNELIGESAEVRVGKGTLAVIYPLGAHALMR